MWLIKPLFWGSEACSRSLSVHLSVLTLSSSLLLIDIEHTGHEGFWEVLGITSWHGTGWVKQEWCTAGSTYSLLNSKKTVVGKCGNGWQPWRLWPWNRVPSPGRSEEEEQQSEDLYSGNCSLGTHGKQLLRVNEVREMSGL